MDTHVSRLRSALALTAECGVRMAPVYGHGYRLDARKLAEMRDAAPPDSPDPAGDPRLRGAAA